MIIANYFQNDNYEKLIRERYTEIHKAKSEKEVQILITRYKDRVEKKNYKEVKAIVAELKSSHGIYVKTAIAKDLTNLTYYNNYYSHVSIIF